MKLFLLLALVLTSFSSFATKIPAYCGSSNQCVLDKNMFYLNKGTGYVKAEGRDCDEALEVGAEKLKEIHGNICSRNKVQPWGCYKTSRGMTEAWSRCDLNKKSSIEIDLPSMRCAPGVIFC